MSVVPGQCHTELEARQELVCHEGNGGWGGVDFDGHCKAVSRLPDLAWYRLVFTLVHFSVCSLRSIQHSTTSTMESLRSYVNHLTTLPASPCRRCDGLHL